MRSYQLRVRKALLLAAAALTLAVAEGTEAAPAQVATGLFHTCALSSAGEVKCWGGNGHGQLGDATITNHSTPRTVIGLNAGVKAIAGGDEHTCALTASGAVKCWGANQYGALGDGTTTDRYAPVTVSGLGSGVVAISAAANQTCAVTAAGGAKCWGGNPGGLGDGTTTQSSTPVNVSGLTSGVAAMSTGIDHACALLGSGALKCWGANLNGAVGDGTTTPRSTPTDVAGLSSGVAAVSAGGFGTCALTAGGGVKCWGGNFYGQVGDGTTTDRLTPVDVSGLTSGMVGIDGGWGHACAVNSSGTAKCWGVNAYGQLGDGTAVTRLTPVEVGGPLAAVIGIAAGTNHSCAVSSTGSFSCWGGNPTGQLGDGTFNNRPLPVRVAGLAVGVAMVAPGSGHSCALSSGGAVSCWGANGSGQLGDGTTTDRLTPGEVTGLASDTIAISTGLGHACALSTSGGVKCWGFNGSGELGDASNIHRSIPTAVSGLASGVVAIAAGSEHSCAVTGAGGVKCWGNNNQGQLGDGTTSPSNIPVDVAGLSDVVRVVAGDAHTCALTTSGGLKCWGWNGWGQIGDGTVMQRLTPVDVTGLASGVVSIDAASRGNCVVTAAGGAKCWGYGVGSAPTDVDGLTSGVAAITTGFGHSCTLVDSGGVKCWGENGKGQVGDGTTTSRPPSIDVIGLASGVVSVAAAPLSTCAVLADGTVKCWGDNSLGQLGTGVATNTGYTTPVGIARPFPDFIAVDAGAFHSCALTSTGGVKCWGWNDFDQLGVSGRNQGTAVEVSGLASPAVAVDGSFLHTCALTSAGGVKCWGDGSLGQRGDGTTTRGPTAVDVSGLTSGVVAIAAGGFHTCALTSAGGVKCWGYGDRGQLGDGTTTNRLTPVDVSGLTSGVVAIAAGGRHTCALTSAGGVKCWGHNFWGQIGDGTTTDRLTAVDVSGLTSGVVAIATFDIHTCALTSASGVKCWGYGASGRLGDGAATDRLTPVDVNGLTSGIVAIAAGSGHTCALTSAGGAKCWGANSYGEVGDGTNMDRLTAADVSGLMSSVVAISTGAAHTCALTIAGGLKCWGSNREGSVGDGQSRNELTPVSIHECGDHTREPSETCDDGNVAAGDCCSALCQLEQPPGGSCQTASQLVSSVGGTVTTTDHTASISVPAGALGGLTPISITGQSGSNFNLGAGAQTAVAVDFGPNGQTFSTPATITLYWRDGDRDGAVDGTSPPLYESLLVVYHNGTAITGECRDVIHQPGTCTTACCDPVYNTWTFQTSSFSEFAVAAPECDPISGAQLKLTKLNKPGANGLSLKGEVSLSMSDFSALNPVADGIRLVLSDSTSGLIDMVVPAGPYDGAAKKGWKVNGSATTWTFIDMTKPDPTFPTPRTGISKVVVKRSTRTPGRVTVQVTGKNGSYAVAPPPVVDVLLNQNVCFRASFPGPGLPLCYYNGNQTTLICR